MTALLVMLLWVATRPPCFLAMARTMNKPSPVPFTLFTARLGTR